jgi:hypothetical protein
MSQPRRRASRHVTLVLSGALTCAGVAGCGPSAEQLEVQALNDPRAYTNNSYVSGRGYYHSTARVWYPYSWGQHDVTRGYFYDGKWSQTPQVSPSHPTSTPVGVGRVVAGSSSAGIARGGFGSSARSSSS